MMSYGLKNKTSFSPSHLLLVPGSFPGWTWRCPALSAVSHNSSSVFIGWAKHPLYAMRVGTTYRCLKSLVEVKACDIHVMKMFSSCLSTLIFFQMCSDSSSCFNRMYLQMCVSCDLISKHNFSSADADLWVEGKRLGVIGVNDWWVGLKDDALTGRLESSSTHSHQQVHHLGRKGILCLYLMPFLTHFQANMTQEPASVSIITNQKWTSSQLPLQSNVSVRKEIFEKRQWIAAGAKRYK